VTSVLGGDGEPDIALICRLALSLEGFDVDERGSGRSALDYLADNTPDVVLLDLRLPDLSGWEVLDELRSTGRLDDLRVILFSAHASAAQAAKEAGCAAFISKPFTPDDLVNTVRIAAERDKPAT
jgi:two-component system KDP operon response regulator KdpE